MATRPLLTASGAHLRIVALLAEYRELADAQVVRRYQARAYRNAHPWPIIAESSLRTRRAELATWGEVVAIGQTNSASTERHRMLTVWTLNPVPHVALQDQGQPVTASPGFTLVLDELRQQTDDLVVLEALAAFAARVGVRS